MLVCCEMFDEFSGESALIHNNSNPNNLQTTAHQLPTAISSNRQTLESPQSSELIGGLAWQILGRELLPCSWNWWRDQIYIVIACHSAKIPYRGGKEKDTPTKTNM